MSMDGIIESAKHLRELLSGVVVNQKAAEVLYSLNILVDQQLKSINFQPATYVVYASKADRDALVDGATIISRSRGRPTDQDGETQIATGSSIVKSVVNESQSENTGAVIVSQFTSQRTSKHKEEEMRYKCAFCDYKAHRKFMVQKHMVYHTGEKPHHCDQCDYRVAYKSDLKKHMRKHTGEKPYSCGVCNQTFRQAAGLRSHMLIHTGEKPYKCAYCDFRSVQSSTVKGHVATKHLNEKKYACKLCDQRCISNTLLKLHIRRKHVGEAAKTFICTKCDFKTFTQYAINRHVRARHSDPDAGKPTGPVTCQLCDNGIIHDSKSADCYMCNECDFIVDKCYEMWSHVKEKHPSSCDLA